MNPWGLTCIEWGRIRPDIYVYFYKLTWFDCKFHQQLSSFTHWVMLAWVLEEIQ